MSERPPVPEGISTDGPPGGQERTQRADGTYLTTGASPRASGRPERRQHHELPPETATRQRPWDGKPTMIMRNLRRDRGSVAALTDRSPVAWRLSYRLNAAVIVARAEWPWVVDARACVGCAVFEYVKNQR
jgi:hypothetical protein